jgi:archaellum component FlaF (FlaF/FlaG flagellin family)
MSLAEAKQLFGTLILGSTVITIAILYTAYKFAEISYRKAHKVKKVHKARKINNANVMFNIDSKNKTLQEIQLEKAQMIKLLGGI